MQTISFEVPDLDQCEVVDLSNALTALSGVAHVDIEGRTVRVEYDDEYSHPALIRSNIEGAGYPVKAEGTEA
jgi:copper chaperone CopZ